MLPNSLMQKFIPLLTQALRDNDISATSEDIVKFAKYLELIQTWNRVFNLTAILDPQEMVYLHIIDSLKIQPFLHGSHLLDVGSGAGLPGIPLAIMNKDRHWTLLDKNNKKTRFMTQAVAELGLKNVTVVHSRTEDFHPSQCFDSILSRAFSTIPLFIETTKHALCKTGIFIAMKGKYPQDELAELPPSYQVQNATRLEIKGMDVERHVICIGTKH